MHTGGDSFLCGFGVPVFHFPSALWSTPTHRSGRFLRSVFIFVFSPYGVFCGGNVAKPTLDIISPLHTPNRGLLHSPTTLYITLYSLDILPSVTIW